jgi:hypothetical protein
MAIRLPPVLRIMGCSSRSTRLRWGHRAFSPTKVGGRLTDIPYGATHREDADAVSVEIWSRLE